MYFTSDGNVRHNIIRFSGHIIPKIALELATKTTR